MKKNKKNNKKQFNLRDYKVYITVLIGLFIILFALIIMAVGMIKDFYHLETTSEESFVKTNNLETPYETETEYNKKPINENVKSNENKDDTLLILVNRNNPVPDDAVYTLKKIADQHYVDERAFDDLQAMLDAASKEGYKLIICSSWRSRSLQEQLYTNKIEEYLSYGYYREQAEELSAFWVALPGTSEHEIGLAVDIVSENNQILDHSQATTKEQQWLMKHCHEYGFILRYPEEKQDITMIGYEPWHYRYVGVEAATEIMKQGICLEEYLTE